MKRMGRITAKSLLVVSILCMMVSLTACGSKVGPFSGEGGWKNEENGIIWLMEPEGSGYVLSLTRTENEEVSPLIPEFITQSITWEDDGECVKGLLTGNTYELKKIKANGVEALEAGDLTYTRMGEEELKEYRDKVAAIDLPKETDAKTESDSESRNEEIILDEPITIIDNDMVTVKVIRFFREVKNEGRDSEFVDAGFEIEAENKTKDYDISLFPRECSLSDRRVINFSAYGGYEVPAGKIANLRYIKSENGDFENLQSLYELYGIFDMDVTDENYSYPDLSKDLEFSIPDSLDSKAAAETAAAANQGYEDVIDALKGMTWYYNGGSNTKLNSISFTETEAAVSQVYFDGNGRHENGTSSAPFIVDDAAIHVTDFDGKEVDIPYTLENASIKLGNGEYYTAEEVKEGLLGYWKTRRSETILGSKTSTEKNIHIEDRTLTSEKASLANGSTSGEYYYYGPYTGSYKLTFGGFDTDMSHGSEWFFNIIKGEVTLLNYDQVCTRSNGLPGENGYSF